MLQGYGMTEAGSKSLSLANFSIPHFEPMILDYPLILVPRWAPIVVNSMIKSYQ